VRNAITPEALVRSALHAQVLPVGSSTRSLEEFWIPTSNERVDIAVVNGVLSAYEIKTHRDTLRRLPRQASAFGRVFDYCTAVVAERHLEKALDIIPNWWGVVCVVAGPAVVFSEQRAGRLNRDVDPNVLVRLLRREEVAAALEAVAGTQPAASTRAAMWRQLLESVDLDRLRGIVRSSLLARTGEWSRLPSKQLRRPPPSPAADQ